MHGTVPPVGIETLSLITSDGVELEAELSVPVDPWAAVVLAHPHPRQGGNMRSLVTGALFTSLPEAGVAALRFNFRGVEGSGGTYGHGVDERLDIEAAVDVLAPVTEGLPLVVSGWSFGADTSLTVVDERLDGWAPVALPLRIVEPDDMGAALDPRPKCVIIARHDQFRDPASAKPILAGWTNTEVHVVDGADHFFVGRTDRVAELIVGFLRGLSSPSEDGGGPA